MTFFSPHPLFTLIADSVQFLVDNGSPDVSISVCWKPFAQQKGQANKARQNLLNSIVRTFMNQAAEASQKTQESRRHAIVKKPKQLVCRRIVAGQPASTYPLAWILAVIKPTLSTPALCASSITVATSCQGIPSSALTNSTL
jgi:hypothetical protein